MPARSENGLVTKDSKGRIYVRDTFGGPMRRIK